VKASHSGTGARSHGGQDLRCSTCRTGEHHSHKVDCTCPCWCGQPTGANGADRVGDRVAGGLLGLCVGDALGATTEFMSPSEIARRLGRHTEITGGGLFKWAPGQGTDDSDMAMAVARAYVAGYSLERVSEGFLAWYRGRPKDVGGTTAAALSLLEKGASPRKTGRDDERSAANGGLMRCVVTGLVRPVAELRRQEAREISAITHSERRCLQAVTAHCDLTNHLLEGASPADALGWVLAETPLDDDVAGVLDWAPGAAAGDLDTSGYVLGTLGVGVWALFSGLGFEEALIAVVNLGGDADTTGAVAGGLLGAHYGAAAVPVRWAGAVAYGHEVMSLAPSLYELRFGSTL
jgi:ADP-ribosyl-[dinitrogen reductase] hydrolase